MKAAPLKGAAFSQIGELYRCEGFPQSKTARSRIRMERDDLEYRMSGGAICRSGAAGASPTPAGFVPKLPRRSREEISAATHPPR